MQTRTVTFYKAGNMLLLEPTTDRMFEILRPLLSFQEPLKAYGYEASKRKRAGLPVMEFKSHVLFELDHKLRLATTFGFWRLLRDALRSAGYQVVLKETAPGNPQRYSPVFTNIEKYALRDNQPDFLQKLLTSRCGRFDCPPGFGKSFMIGLLAAVLPYATVDVVTRRVAVLRDRIYPELVQMVGDVGIVGGGMNVRNKRVMCYTVGSMRHSPATADILIGDEVHELGADHSAAQLTRWQNSRNFGFSASQDLRWDGKDLRMHGIFGPVIFNVGYSQAQEANMVVPIRIIWQSVVMDYDPCFGWVDVEKKRNGIWCNDYRNSVIAADAKSYADDVQVLITVDTLEHAMNLKRLLPDFTLVYMENGLSARVRDLYARQGFCASDEPLLDLVRRQRLTKEFESGKLKKVICTTVWNVGVSFNSLAVLIRADGGGSAINDVQIPGRVSRIDDGKDCGIVRDYLDQFNIGFRRRAAGRAKSYARNKWEQVFPRATMMQEFLR